MDSTRYDTAVKSLLRYKDSRVKKLLKKKFVTGQTRDKVMDNLMNESDSDVEGKDSDGNIVDKDQLARMEANEAKKSVKEKKAERRSKNEPKTDGDLSDSESAGSEGEELKKPEKGHKPLKKDPE